LGREKVGCGRVEWEMKVRWGRAERRFWGVGSRQRSGGVEDLEEEISVFDSDHSFKKGKVRSGEEMNQVVENIAITCGLMMIKFTSYSYNM